MHLKTRAAFRARNDRMLGFRPGRRVRKGKHTRNCSHEHDDCLGSSGTQTTELINYALGARAEKIQLNELSN